VLGYHKQASRGVMIFMMSLHSAFSGQSKDGGGGCEEVYEGGGRPVSDVWTRATGARRFVQVPSCFAPLIFSLLLDLALWPCLLNLQFLLASYMVYPNVDEPCALQGPVYLSPRP
jgi:hypothetical protein